jgi:phosphatidylglycerol---prolipoprotein diacylglyceryl transferase
MLRFPNIDPVALKLGPVKIHWYGIMYVVGFAIGWWLGRRQAARPGSTWKPDDVDDVVFWAMVAGILGGRIGYVLIYGHDAWAEDPWYPVKIWQGGMSIHGGLAGAILALCVYARRCGRRMLDVLDFTAPLVCPGMFVVRIGNFINSELWGRPTDWKWGFLVADPDTGELIGRHASQLYEAGLEGIVLFALLWWAARKPLPRGTLSGLFLIGYAVARMLVEFVRVPDTQIGYLAGDWFTMGQALSLPMLAAGILLLLRAQIWPQPSGNYAAVR